MRGLLLIAALVMGAHPAPQAGLAAQALEFPVLAADAPAGDGAVGSCSSPRIPGTVRCGVFRVDEDGVAGGRTLDLHFVILDALAHGPIPPDPVLYFPGGPGVAAIPVAMDMGRLLATIRRTRDVILVDLRGVGLSGALDCDVPYPRGLESRFGGLFAVDHVERCRDALAKRADLSRYTTSASVDDVEALRQWLGHPQVNLYGASYGTRVAQVYMRRHPAAVRTVVMNGVVPVDRPAYVQTSRNLQDALDRLVAECEAHTDCRAAYPRFRAQLMTLLDRLEAGPVYVRVAGRPLPFTQGDLAYALRGLLYGRAGEIPYLVDRAAAGDLDGLVRYYLERTFWVGATGGGAGNHLSVVCAEDIQRATESAAERATGGTLSGEHAIRSYREACAVWPAARLPESYFTPVVSDVPTLLLSGAGDPATPPSGGARVASHLSRGLHVVVPQVGHGVLDLCVLRMVIRLLDQGDVAGLDPSCVGAVPLRFRLPTG
jgi:pimeloyl-ACP methyl ester carboxylesterase